MHAKLGTIVKSNSHIDYVCQIIGPGEAEQLPDPADFAFGVFVRIELNDPNGTAGSLIGLIYDTLLLNPDFGSLGPRLSPRQDLEVFAPDYLSETATLVGILAVGEMDTRGENAHQGIPALAASVNSPVQLLQPEDLRSFHTDAQGQLCLHYMPLLLGHNTPLATQLLLNVINRLTVLFPDQRSQLAVVRNNLAWKSIVQPSG